MKIFSVKAKNFGPFAELDEMRLGSLATIVGRNDAGKTHIIRLLQAFFNPSLMEPDNIHRGTPETQKIEIEVAFTDLPTTFTLDETETSFRDEMLIDVGGQLRIKKVYPLDNLKKPEIFVVSNDFDDDGFSKLVNWTDTQLKARCGALGLDQALSKGTSIPLKVKRDAIHSIARQNGVRLKQIDVPIKSSSSIWKEIEKLLPLLTVFESDTKLDVDETGFQNKFKVIVKSTMENAQVESVRSDLEGRIKTGLQNEVDKIHTHMLHHSSDLTSLKVVPSFNWEKGVEFDIVGVDRFGVEQSLSRRGTGIKRILMVSSFQYLSERDEECGNGQIFAVEEPENSLHPSLQRELVRSFRRLSETGCQVIITTHSPVFAGSSPTSDLILITRDDGHAKVIQNELKRDQVAEELGVEPSDQITGYSACVFVEGPDDEFFFRAIAKKLKESGHSKEDFDDVNIGFVKVGGDNLKHWIDKNALKKWNRRFCLVIDSDREAEHQQNPQKKERWKQSCIDDGGKAFILRKREIENYISREALQRDGRTITVFGPFDNIKKAYGDNVFKLIANMSSSEILMMDQYSDENGEERHELKEIVDAILHLANPV